MEGLVTIDVLLTFLGGTVLTAVIAVLRNWATKRNIVLSKAQVQVLVLAGSVLIGTGYTAFKSFVPMESQRAIVDFMWQTATACVFIYEFIWKNLFGSVKK